MKKGTKKGWLIAIIVILILIVAQNVTNKSRDSNKHITRGKTFRLISSSENADLEQTLQEFARKNNIKLSIDYAGTIDIMEKLNNKEQYDAVWTSNSIWLYMLDKSVSVKNSKSTSINPVVFGIKKSKAKELGFIDKEVSTKDILTEIQNGKLKFSMSNKHWSNSIFRIFSYTCWKSRNTKSRRPRQCRTKRKCKKLILRSNKNIRKRRVFGRDVYKRRL